jgi:methylmalonyl-CoA/ethylmalonyl-CoA epimerase
MSGMLMQTKTNLGSSDILVAPRLHHIGFVVPRIADAAPRFIASLQMTWDGEVFHDPAQTVRVTFLRHASAEEPLIELVEPASPQSRVNSFLKRGGGLHHLCYETDSLSGQLQAVLAAGAVMVLEPTPAVAFSSRKIAWIYTREKLLVEYLERKAESANEEQ